MNESVPDPVCQHPVLLLVESQKEVIAFLRGQGQESYAIAIERELAKLFVLSAASYFEARIVDYVTRLTDHLGDERVTSLVRRKAVKRQYHTYFDWDSRKLGPFRSLFGDGVSDSLKVLLERSDFCDSLDAFLEIGQSRNMLVHGNFATQSLSGTIDEWIAKYKSACKFLDTVRSLLGPKSLDP